MPVKIRIGESVKGYNKLSHYCSLNTLSAILSNRTWKCNRLDLLNDVYESKRLRIEKFAKDYFVACFCHSDYEIVPFWFNYGGNDNRNKVLLRLPNLSNTLKESIYDDYFITSTSKKMYYDTRDNFVYKVGNISCILNENPEFDSRNAMQDIMLKDIEYLQADDPVFYKEYAKVEMTNAGKVNYCDIRSLGINKTRSWDYEKETRIICRLRINQTGEIEWIFLRLKDEFFENMEIILNPWADKEIYKEVINIINNAQLNENIVNTFRIEKSELSGTLR